jgi:MFS family permease
MVANSLGLAIGLIKDSLPATLLFVVVFGFAMGGVATAGPVMLAHLFGRESYASVARFMGFLGRLSILGYMIARQSLKMTGSYDAAFAIFIVLNIIGAVLISTTKPLVDETGAT